jgi:hypothetical protein
MRRIIGSSVGGLIALTATLGLAVGLTNVAAEEQSKSKREGPSSLTTPFEPQAEFYVSDGECGLAFTIAYRNETITGSIAFADDSWTLRLPAQSFLVVNGKLTENTGDVFDAILSKKKLAIGFYDGTILPIDLLGLDPKPFIACVEYSLRVRNNLH